MYNSYEKGEPPNRSTVGRRLHSPKEGDTRQIRVMTNPPKLVSQVYRNGRWVAVGRSVGKGTGGKKVLPKGAKKGGMSLGNAIKSMQRDKPWN